MEPLWFKALPTKFECYRVADSEEGSGIEDTALGSESEDHWEELSDNGMEEEEKTEAEEEEGVDMSSWELTVGFVLQWYDEEEISICNK